jgi:hypothetical protein
MTTFTWSSLIGILKLLAGLLSDVTRTPSGANPSNSHESPLPDFLVSCYHCKSSQRERER